MRVRCSGATLQEGFFGMLQQDMWGVLHQKKCSKTSVIAKGSGFSSFIQKICVTPWQTLEQTPVLGVVSSILTWCKEAPDQLHTKQFYARHRCISIALLYLSPFAYLHLRCLKEHDTSIHHVFGRHPSKFNIRNVTCYHYVLLTAALLQ